MSRMTDELDAAADRRIQREWEDHCARLAHDPVAEMERERRRLARLNPPKWPDFSRDPTR